MTTRKLLTAATIIALLPGLASAVPAWKDDKSAKNSAAQKAETKAGGPPPWAPAHGYRAKQGKKDGGDDYVIISQQIGIPSGTCNREAVGAVLGGVVGGAIGSEVGRHNDNQALGTMAGAVIGVLVGSHIGREMDKADHQCTGQVLERALDGQTVTWRNPDTGAEFRMTPTTTYQQGDRYCRAYVTRIVENRTVSETEGKACRDDAGQWEPLTRM